MMGYSALLSGNNDPNGRGDLHEGFEFGWEALDSQSDIPEASATVGKNSWPSAMPKLREAALRY